MMHYLLPYFKHAADEIRKARSMEVGCQLAIAGHVMILEMCGCKLVRLLHSS